MLRAAPSLRSVAASVAALLFACEAANATDWRTRQISEATAVKEFTADGEWIVFYRSETSPSASRLYSVRRWLGSTPTPITSPFPEGQGLDSYFRLTSDSRRVLFLSWEKGSGYNRLWSAPVDGASGPVQLGPTTPPPGEITWYSASPEGTRGLFVGAFDGWNKYALLSAPIDGSAAAVQLNPVPLDPRGTLVSDVSFVGDGTHVLFVAEATVYRRQELWYAPIDGSSPAVRLNVDLPPDDSCRVNGYWLVPAEERVLYRVSCLVVGGPDVGVWSAPWDGSGTAVRLAATVDFAGVDPTGSRAVLIRDFDGDSLAEFWSVPVEGPESALVLLVESGGPALALAGFSASGSHAVIQAALLNPLHEEVWSVATDGSASAVRMSPPIAPTAGHVSFEVRVEPGSENAVFAGNTSGFQLRDLFGAPADGSAAAVQLNVPGTGEGVRDFQFVGDPARVVYNLFAADSQLAELWSSTVDEPGTSIRLSPPPAASGGAYQFYPSSRGDFVYFDADLSPEESNELWVVPALGPPAAAIRLSPELVPGGQLVNPPIVSPDGFGLLYSGRFEDAARTDLWLSDAMLFKADFEEDDASEWSLVVGGP